MRMSWYEYQDSGEIMSSGRVNNILKAIPAILLVGMVFSCKNSIDEIDALTDPMSMPVQTTTDAEYVYTESGKMLNRLVASKLERYDATGNKKIVVSGGFTFYTYDSLEQVSSTLTAENGTFFEEEEIFVATDDVELKNTRGETLNTEKLTWWQRQDRVFTNTLVKITTEDGILWGDSLESNSSFDNYKLIRPRGELDVKEETDDGA